MTYQSRLRSPAFGVYVDTDVPRLSYQLPAGRRVPAALGGRLRPEGRLPAPRRTHSRQTMLPGPVRPGQSAGTAAAELPLPPRALDRSGRSVAGPDRVGPGRAEPSPRMCLMPLPLGFDTPLRRSGSPIGPLRRRRSFSAVQRAAQHQVTIGFRLGTRSLG